MAIEAGADFLRVSNALGWLEFDELVAHVEMLKNAGFVEEEEVTIPSGVS